MHFIGNIVLLTNDSELYVKISGILDKYEISWQQFNLTRLMVYIYKFDPVAIIVDLDFYEYSIYKSITMSDIDNDIPVLALYSKDRSVLPASDTVMEYYMHKSEIAANLPNIIKIISDFKSKYTDIKQCYSINDIINSQTDSLLKKSIGNEFSYIDSIEMLLKSVYSSSMHINRPKKIVIGSCSEEGTEVDIYHCNAFDIVNTKESIELSDTNKLFSVKSDFNNAFYMNCNNQEFSDLDSSESVFDKELKQKLGEIANFAGYITTDTAILGVNYDNNVTQFDAGIVKELCINYNLIQNIYRQRNKVSSAFIYTVNALSRASEANDDDTGVHIKRVNAYSLLIANYLGLDKKYKDTIAFSAQMHDVGKLSVPKDILIKPGKLTTDEFDVMKNHTIYGAKIIGDSPQLTMAAEIAISHHEKFDGSGYPYKKIGEDIPLSGRIVAMADVYDALRTERVYKPAYGHKTAYDIITKGDGRVMPQHFDPVIFEIFKTKGKEFNDIFEEIE